MTRAQHIVRRLLEMSADGTTLRFGPGDDPYGEEFFSLADAGAPDEQAMQKMIQQGHTFVVQTGPKDVRVYGSKKPIQSQKGVAQYVADVFNIAPDTQVHFGNQPGQRQGVPLNQLFFEKPEREKKPPVQATGVAQPPRASHPQMLEPDPEREAYVASLQGKTVRQNVPYHWGMEVQGVGGRNSGVRVIAVDPNGPAARGGLVAGDRIVQIGPFETPQGTNGPWRVQSLKAFHDIESTIHPGFTVPMGVVRGGSYLDHISVVPDHQKAPAAQERSTVISGAEATQMASAAEPVAQQMRQDIRDLPQLTVGEMAQYYNTSPEVVRYVLSLLDTSARDYTPMRSAAPNERDPASKTGNQKANVAALT